ncbi:hypothetical protein J1TS3_33990 [Siminovitchia fordii]|uniref:Uncharacterized protein n=1 Tax=Siminovitchia fordii TaxID=254759 RepID=A0ABQ4KB31_9BACI|nr:hypothetical protein J1TS3_33990 [Siminovitchia fordii]
MTGWGPCSKIRELIVRNGSRLGPVFENTGTNRVERLRFGAEVEKTGTIREEGDRFGLKFEKTGTNLEERLPVRADV